MMSFSFNNEVLKALSAVAEVRRLQQCRGQSEQNTPKKRQKCDSSDCIPLKSVDYDNLSDHSNLITNNPHIYIDTASGVERAELQKGSCISPGNKENSCTEEIV